MEVHESSLDAIAAKEVDDLRQRIQEYADNVSWFLQASVRAQ